MSILGNAILIEFKRSEIFILCILVLQVNLDFSALLAGQQFVRVITESIFCINT